MWGITLLSLVLIGLYAWFKTISRAALWETLLRTASNYPLTRCHGRYQVGMLYGHLHALTQSVGLSPNQRHLLTARALDQALLYPASHQLAIWLQHNDKDVIKGWYHGRQLFEQPKSGWNKDDHNFLQLFD